MDIKPIETVYNGYRFRSRLEARWAVFFDEMGIKYEYEPEGYVLPDGSKYLPDFRLLNVRHRSYDDEWEPVYVEVKGIMSPYDKKRIKQFPRPLIVLGSLPANCDECFDKHYETCGVFYSFSYMDNDNYPAVFSVHKGIPWIAGPQHDEFDGGFTMDKALLKARQARFEHGETPTGGIR